MEKTSIITTVEINKTLLEDYGITDFTLRANLVIYIQNLITEERVACAKIVERGVGDPAKQIHERSDQGWKDPEVSPPVWKTT